MNVSIYAYTSLKYQNYKPLSSHFNENNDPLFLHLLYLLLLII